MFFLIRAIFSDAARCNRRGTLSFEFFSYISCSGFTLSWLRLCPRVLDVRRFFGTGIVLSPFYYLFDVIPVHFLEHICNKGSSNNISCLIASSIFISFLSIGHSSSDAISLYTARKSSFITL